MSHPWERWHAAIGDRHSIRSFNGQPLGEADLKRLSELAAGLSGPAARAVLATEAAESVFRGLVGSYGKIRRAPAYAAIIGNTGSPSFLERAGYIGEGIVLEAVSMGLGTCWVAWTYRPDVVARVAELKTGEKALAVIAIGHPLGAAPMRDRMIKKIQKSHERKELGQLTGGLPEEEWPPWAMAALDAARLAPSAVNRQPWHFQVEEDAVTVSVDNLKDSFGIPKRLDCGIAMLHLEAGARHAGVRGRWEHLEAPKVARFVKV